MVAGRYLLLNVDWLQRGPSRLTRFGTPESSETAAVAVGSRRSGRRTAVDPVRRIKRRQVTRGGIAASWVRILRYWSTLRAGVSPGACPG